MDPRDPIKIYDARWEVDDFTEAEIGRFIESVLLYGRELGVDTLTLARDARLGAGAVMERFVETAVGAGFNVYLCTDPISTPQSYFLSLWTSREHPATMGLTVTASHNPPSYVGLKIVVPVVQAIGLDCGPLGGFTRIREIYHDTELLKARSGGQLTIVNLSESYIAFSMKAAGISKNQLAGTVVVLDSLNGSAGPELHRALLRAGVSVAPLHLVPDGTFPAGAPNPTSLGKLKPALALAGELHATLLVGIDGDGDRLVFGDSEGLLNAGFAAIPILEQLIPGSGKPTAALKELRVMYDPKVNPLALAEWVKLNIKPVLFGNGHSQIKEYMKRIDALAAVEESGHYYHRQELGETTVYAENSLITTLTLLKALKEDATLKDRLRALQNRVFTTGEINYQLSDDQSRDRAMEAVLQSLCEEQADLMSKTGDGIDLRGTVFTKGLDLAGELGRQWYSGYVRISTNEKSVLRAYLCSGNADLGRRMEEKIRGICQHYGGRPVE
jgi:phosphomannomutase